MNSYTYDKIDIGHVESFKVELTTEKLRLFSEITGDCNPLHNDEAFSRKRGYPCVISHGMLTASFLSTLAGVYLPGQNDLVHEVSIRLVKPVLIGNGLDPSIQDRVALTVTGKVVDKQDIFRRIIVKVTITNDSEGGEPVLRGVMKIGVAV
ncbi:MAG: dehydratase [Oscillospiraceae bacterium]|jgi:acyl dehydratase|nr:dehydratase [Oscillospiraceae bacterium]